MQIRSGYLDSLYENSNLGSAFNINQDIKWCDNGLILLEFLAKVKGSSDI